MNANPTALKQLMAVGLNMYEAKVLLAIQGRGDVTARDLARASGIPRQRVYDVLNALQMKGLCTEIPGPVLTYRATDLKNGLLNMLVERNREFQRDLDEKRRIAIALADTLQVEEAGPPTNGRLIEVIRNPTQILLRYDQLLLGAEREVLATAKLPYVQEMAEETYEKVVHGVEVHFLIERSALSGAPGMIEAIFRLYGDHEHRFCDHVPMKFDVFDGERSMLYLPYENRYGIVALVIENAALAGALARLFWSLWEDATPHIELEEEIARAIAEVRE
ncbi:MAG TPA: TrmB family transcriptional regulator [Thermoplasmata archaeon]|nr:TrmB family transcriptional regulator [Thermoplasmata archaeon]